MNRPQRFRGLATDPGVQRKAPEAVIRRTGFAVGVKETPTDGALLFQACHLVSQMPLVPLEVFGSPINWSKMMETKHTPGPWGVDDNHGKRYIEPINSNEPIAQVFKQQGDKDAYLANAKLIAAAPDLLEALKACSEELRFMIDKHNVRNSDDGSFPYDHQTVAEAHAAIAKATA